MKRSEERKDKREAGTRRQHIVKLFLKCNNLIITLGTAA